MSPNDKRSVDAAVKRLNMYHDRLISTKDLMYLLYQLGIALPYHYKGDAEYRASERASLKRTLDMLGLLYPPNKKDSNEDV